MANFDAQVEALIGLSISDSGTTPTNAQLGQFLTDGAKEIINHLPKHLLPLCSAEQSFTSGTPNTLNTGKVLNVFRNDGDIKQPCRQIDSSYKGRVLDSDDMDYATVTDPVYYIDNNTMDVLPSGGSVTYSEVQYPTVGEGDSAIASFPDEAEHLVVLYGTIKSLQNVLGNRSSNSDITTALTAMKDAIEAAEAVFDGMEGATESVFGDEDTFTTANSQLTRVKDALDKVSQLIEANKPDTGYDAHDLLKAEDIELLQGNLSIVNTELKRAQMHLSEWNAIGDMRIKQINASLAEAQGYASEIQSRLAVDSNQYGWYEKQQAKLQADYEKGLQALIGARA